MDRETGRMYNATKTYQGRKINDIYRVLLTLRIKLIIPFHFQQTRFFPILNLFLFFDFNHLYLLFLREKITDSHKSCGKIAFVQLSTLHIYLNLQFSFKMNLAHILTRFLIVFCLTISDFKAIECLIIFPSAPLCV